MTTQYILTDNATGDEYIMDFKPADFHLSVKDNDGLHHTFCQAVVQLDIWNRAQKNYKSEFTYTLICNEQGNQP